MNITCSWDDLRKRTLYIGTPMYGGQCCGFYTQSMLALARLLQARGIQVKEFYLFNESLIPRARNYIVDEFMRSGFTHLLFIDSDIGFDPDQVLQLLALADPQSDKHILGAPYPKKCIAWEKIKRAVDKGFADSDARMLEHFVGDFVFNPMSGTTEIDLQLPVEVQETGTGFMMIQRKAFENFADKYPEYLYAPDHIRSEHFDGSREIMAYFHADIGRRGGLTDPNSANRYLSEDYWFCHLAREAGSKTWLCPWMELTHTGSFPFGGSLTALAQLGANPTADPREVKKGKMKSNANRVRAEVI